MAHRPRFRRFCIAAAAAAVVLLQGSAAAAPDATPSPQRQRELVHLLRQDCGSCHGMTLKGGLGPALTAEALRDRPAESLEATIIHGRPGTPMPPWGRFMTEGEARWLVERLLSGEPHGAR
jgi:cytochrome c55X